LRNAAEGLSLGDLRIFRLLPSNEAVCNVVEAGAGATIVSEHVVAPAIAQGRLKAVTLALPPRDVVLLRHRDRHVAAATKALIRSLADSRSRFAPRSAGGSGPWLTRPLVSAMSAAVSEADSICSLRACRLLTHLGSEPWP
jgi:hypothetical protein